MDDAVETLEEITFGKSGFIRLSDGSVLEKAEAVGNPFLGARTDSHYRFGEFIPSLEVETPVEAVQMAIVKQGLAGVANAYSLRTISKRIGRADEYLDLYVGQLYRIE